MNNNILLIFHTFFIASLSENNVFIQNSIKINVFSVVCNNGKLYSNLSQNCLCISNSQKIKIFNLLIFNCFGNKNALGLILKNEQNINDSYVLNYIFSIVYCFKVFIFNSSFNNNSVSSNTIEFPGTLLYFYNVGTAYIFSCFFKVIFFEIKYSYKIFLEKHLH